LQAVVDIAMKKQGEEFERRLQSQLQSQQAAPVHGYGLPMAMPSQGGFGMAPPPSAQAGVWPSQVQIQAPLPGHGYQQGAPLYHAPAPAPALALEREREHAPVRSSINGLTSVQWQAPWQPGAGPARR
jgi:hypothetical protein